MTDKQYEEGLYRRYVAGEGIGDGATHWYEYDRDEQAERDAALGAAMRKVLVWDSGHSMDARDVQQISEYDAVDCGELGKEMLVAAAAAMEAADAVPSD